MPTVRPAGAAGDTAAPAAQEAADEQSYVVAHDNVGQYFKGELVKKSHFAPDTDFARLFALGALLPEGGYEAGAVLRDFDPHEVTPLNTAPGVEAPVRPPEGAAPGAQPPAGAPETTAK